MNPKACVITGLMGVGLTFIVVGIGIRLGYWKKWYLAPDDPIFYPKPGVYGFVPLGLFCWCTLLVLVLRPCKGISSDFPRLESGQNSEVILLQALSEPWQTFATGAAFSFVILGIFLVGLQPRWIKPQWVRWLEEENDDILDRLIQEAHWTKDWEKRIATQEGLETWVAEVREKWGEPRVKLSSKPGRASIPREARGRWILSVAVIVVSSALGQLFLGNGLIGFIAGWGVLLVIYWLQPKERAGD